MKGQGRGGDGGTEFQRALASGASLDLVTPFQKFAAALDQLTLKTQEAAEATGEEVKARNEKQRNALGSVLRDEGPGGGAAPSGMGARSGSLANSVLGGLVLGQVQNLITQGAGGPSGAGLGGAFTGAIAGFSAGGLPGAVLGGLSGAAMGYAGRSMQQAESVRGARQAGVIGSPLYASPQEARERGEFDARATQFEKDAENVGTLDVLTDGYEISKRRVESAREMARAVKRNKAERFQALDAAREAVERSLGDAARFIDPKSLEGPAFQNYFNREYRRQENARKVHAAIEQMKAGDPRDHEHASGGGSH